MKLIKLQMTNFQQKFLKIRQDTIKILMISSKIFTRLLTKTPHYLTSWFQGNGGKGLGNVGPLSADQIHEAVVHKVLRFKSPITLQTKLYTSRPQQISVSPTATKASTASVSAPKKVGQNKTITLQPVTLPKQSEAIIFLKQHYETLFYDTDSKFPNLGKITFQFFNVNQKKPENYVNITIDAQSQDPKTNTKSKIIIEVFNSKWTGKPIRGELDLDYKILPYDKANPSNAVKLAKQLLQKKIWIQISAALDFVRVNVDDFAPNQTDSSSFSKTVKLGSSTHETWKDQEIVFELNNSSSHPNVVLKNNPISHLNTLLVSYEIGATEMKREDIQTVLDNTSTIKVMKVQKVLNPILSQNPSILTNDGNKDLLTSEIRALYEYLKSLSINELPKFVNTDKNFDTVGYYSWRCLKNAIDKSIKTKPGYFEFTGNSVPLPFPHPQLQPIGILNALMMVKTIDISGNKINIDNMMRWSEFEWKEGNFEDNLKQIFEKRQIYIRFEMLEHEATGPGAMAVLEIWPPFCCSSIHNHGEAFGLIKVIANEICVQNFRDLNFIKADQKPYQRHYYQEGSYSWLSEYSYGIHRLINATSNLTLSLQAYMGDKTSKEYFEFIQNPEDNKSSKKYIEYFPQNDWKNFLAWPDMIQGFSQKPEIVQLLCQYIEIVKKFYHLEDPKNHDFPHFAMVMKQENDLLQKMINLQQQREGRKVRVIHLESNKKV